MRSVGWLLQLLALVIVGTALLVGLFYDALRAEIAMLAAVFCPRTFALTISACGIRSICIPPMGAWSIS